MKTLVVDDDPITRTVIAEMTADYFRGVDMPQSRVDTVDDGLAALEAVRREEYDIVFMDIVMPRMDGIETIREIRKLPKRQPVIVVVTQRDDEELLREGHFSGANWHITKPFDRQELEVLLNDIVASRMGRTTSYRRLGEQAAPEPSFTEPLPEPPPKEASEEEAFGSEEGEDFLFFDSEEIDEAIEQMHPTEKIDAATFMESDLVDEGDIDDLSEAFDSFYHAVDGEDGRFYATMMEVVERCRKIFDRHYEFKELAYGMQALHDFLRHHPLEEYGPQERELLKTLLQSVIDDLEKWKDEVLVNRSAQDIHYLDASLLANIAQIEQTFAPEKSYES